MVHLQNSLLFPTLTYQTDVRFRGPESDKATPIYKLDWSYIDRIKEERWQKHANTSDNKFPGTLPDKYNEWVKSMFFALPAGYLTEIRRNARLIQSEWGIERHFDTMIREICLQPAVSYCYVAFRLLADCLYDGKTNYFYRGPDKDIATQAMLYKFWVHQTGAGLVQDHASFDKIAWKLNEAASPVFKRRNFLLKISCEKCGEQSFIESSSEGWKWKLDNVDVTCSCGNELIKTQTYPIATKKSMYITVDAENDDSSKHLIREFFKAVDEFEKPMLEPMKKETIQETTQKVTPVKSYERHIIYDDKPSTPIKFRNAHESVITDLKGQGYVIHNNNPMSILDPGQASSEGTVIKIIKDKKLPDVRDILKEEIIKTAEEQAYKDQVDPKTETNVSEEEACSITAGVFELRNHPSTIDEQAGNMMLTTLKEGIKDLPKEGVCDLDGESFCRKEGNNSNSIDEALSEAIEIKVLINGMPVMEIKGYDGMSKKDAITMAMEKKEIKKYTKGKALVESFYAPGYCLSLAFKRPDKKLKQGKKK